MSRPSIEALVSHIGPLVGASLFTLDDRLLYGAWTRAGARWDAELGASRWGDVVQSVFAARGQLEENEQLDQLTVESEDSLTIVRPLTEAVAAMFVFEPNTPLGLARFHIARVLAGLEEMVANVAPVGPPRSRRMTQVPPAFKPTRRTSAPPPPPSAPPPSAVPGYVAPPSSAPGGLPPAPAAGAVPPSPTLVTESGAPSSVAVTPRYPHGVVAPAPEPPSPPRTGGTEPPPPNTADWGEGGGGTEPPPPPSTSEYGTSTTGTEPPAASERAPAPSEPAWAREATRPLPPEPARVGPPDPWSPEAASHAGDPRAVTTRRERRDRTLQSGDVMGLGDPPRIDDGDLDEAGAEEVGETVLDDSAAAAASAEADDGPRGLELLEHLTRHAPDAHVVLHRVALQTGIDIQLLRAPDKLRPEELRKVEASARRILGFEPQGIG